VLEGVQLRMIAGPGGVQLCSTSCVQIIKHIPIRVKNADGGY
jgi:hypothetical protein